MEIVVEVERLASSPLTLEPISEEARLWLSDEFDPRVSVTLAFNGVIKPS